MLRDQVAIFGCLMFSVSWLLLAQTRIHIMLPWYLKSRHINRTIWLFTVNFHSQGGQALYKHAVDSRSWVQILFETFQIFWMFDLACLEWQMSLVCYYSIGLFKPGKVNQAQIKYLKSFQRVLQPRSGTQFLWLEAFTKSWRHLEVGAFCSVNPGRESSCEIAVQHCSESEFCLNSLLVNLLVRP